MCAGLDNSCPRDWGFSQHRPRSRLHRNRLERLQRRVPAGIRRDWLRRRVCRRPDLLSENNRYCIGANRLADSHLLRDCTPPGRPQHRLCRSRHRCCCLAWGLGDCGGASRRSGLDAVGIETLRRHPQRSRSENSWTNERFRRSFRRSKLLRTSWCETASLTFEDIDPERDVAGVGRGVGEGGWVRRTSWPVATAGRDEQGHLPRRLFTRTSQQV